MSEITQADVVKVVDVQHVGGIGPARHVQEIRPANPDWFQAVAEDLDKRAYQLRQELDAVESARDILRVLATLSVPVTEEAWRTYTNLGRRSMELPIRLDEPLHQQRAEI